MMILAHSLSGHRGPVYALETWDGYLLSGSGDGSVVRWSSDRIGEGELLANAGQAVFSLVTIGNEGLLLIGTEGGDVFVIDLKAGKEIQHFKLQAKGIFAFCAVENDRVVAAGGDGALHIWRIVPAPAQVRLVFERRIPVIEEKLRDLLLLNDRKGLAVACGDGTIRIFETEWFNEIRTIEAHIGPDPAATGTLSLQHHPRKPVLISGGKDGYLRTWHTDREMRSLPAIAAHKGGIYRITFSPEGDRMATASRDKTIKLWSASGFDPVQKLDRKDGGHTHSVNALRWTEQGLFSGSDDRTIRLWRDQNG